MRSGRRAAAALTAIGCFLLTQCTASGPEPGPTPTLPTASSSPTASGTPTATSTVTSTDPPAVLSEANLPTVDDLAPPLGGGEVEVYARNARTPDRISVCQQPLAQLRPTRNSAPQLP